MAKSKKKRTKKGKQSTAIPDSGPDSQPQEAVEVQLAWLGQMRTFGAMLLREPIAIGLALFILFRPWKDGMTYPIFNVYFTMWIFILSALFVLRMLFRGDKIHNPIPVGIFAAYLLLGYISSKTSVDYDVSLRALINLTSYFFIFVLASNGIRSRLGLGIVLGTLVVTSLVNTVWAVMHTEYVLPYVRESIRTNPHLLPEYFQGATELVPELKNRLEMGRAFGTFLFPNALGGFLALCAPYMLGEALHSIRRFREVVDADKPKAGIENSSFTILLVAGLGSFVMGIYVYSLNLFLTALTGGDLTLVTGSLRTFLFFFFFPTIFGFIGAYIVHLKGGIAYGVILRTLVLFLATVLQLYVLWLTFSRGAYLGVFVGVGLAIFLMCSGLRNPAHPNVFARLWVHAAIALVIVGVYWNPTVGAQSLKDDGFVMPSTEVDYTPHKERGSYDIKELNTEGTKVGLSEIVSPRSLQFRITYWQVSMLIARDHRLLGVGPGNFGTVYGAYQFLDAHPVKMAHNDYLQALVETGIFGFILFGGFWAYFILWGGAKILREPILANRFALVGMYAGVVAFLVHASFDFHFANPSLASAVFLMAGLFYARVQQRDAAEEEVGDPNETVRIQRWMAAGALMILFMSTTASARQFLYDYGRTAGTPIERFYKIGEPREANKDLALMRFLLGAEVQTFFHGKMDEAGVRVRPPYRSVQDFKGRIDSYDELVPLGAVRILLDGGKGATRELLEGEEISDEGIVFFANPLECRTLAYRISDAKLKRLEELDGLYPHGSVMSSYGYEWTHTLATTAIDHAAQLDYSQQCLSWARKGVERSPHNPASYVQLSFALLERGKAEQTIKQLDYFREAVIAYRKSITHYPTEHQLTHNFGQLLINIGDAFVKTGKADLMEEGEEYRAQAGIAFKRASMLARYKHDVLGLR